MTKVRSLLLVAAVLLLFATHANFAIAGLNGQLPSADSQTLTVQRVSEEPDSDERASSVRWSSDGDRVGWMELESQKASKRGKDKELQHEIWTVTADSKSQGTAPDPHPGGSRILLVSAAKITSSLSGSASPSHPKLDEDEQAGNPYMLRDFAWSQDHTSLLLEAPRSIAWLDLSSGNSRILVSGSDELTGATLSPDGRTVSFVRNHQLWLAPVHGGSPRRLTSKTYEGGADLDEGEPDWPYRNELHLPIAHWWSPDSTQIAWLETDDRAVAKYTIRASNGDTHQIVYPKPGGELPIVHVFVQRVSGGAPVEIALGSTKGFYIPRLNWLPDSRHLAVQRLDRLQHSLELILGDSLDGKTRTLLVENDPYWINLSNILYFFKDSKRFIWSSERTGFRHLYLYDTQGKQLEQVTHGSWEVTQLNAVDEADSAIYFTATEKSPLERHLYKINLDGNGLTRITSQQGTHQVAIAPNLMAMIDDFSSHIIPPQLLLTGIDGGNQIRLDPQAFASNDSTPKQIDQKISHHDNPAGTNGTIESGMSSGASALQSSGIQSPPLQPVEFLPLKLHLGAETDAFLIRPPAFDPKQKYPVIVYLAGGPGEQLVRDSWGGAIGLWMQLMAQKGYIIFGLDNQGTSGRGHYFEEPIHLRLAAQELADQRDGLFYLGSLPYVDTTRLGVCGWGYGGFLVIHAMLDRPVPFKAGFAGAPITDWHYYDAVFSERYLDDPVAHADGWAASTAFENDSPRFFKGSLQVAEGSEDEFVHIENTLTLEDQLLDAGKYSDVLLLADRGHTLIDPQARLVLFQTMTDFFMKNL